MNIELELMQRSAGSSTISMVAARLGISLVDRRTGSVHDHRLHRDARRNVVSTVVPDGAPGWAADTAELWTKVEWSERLGGAPVLCELRLPLPEGHAQARASVVADSIARLIATELFTPVSFAMLDGTAPWPVRGDTGMQVRLCFPTRTLAPLSLVGSIVDRSGRPSGFSARHGLVTNPHVRSQFVAHVLQALESMQSQQASSLADEPYPPGRIRMAAVTGAEHPRMVSVREETRRVLEPRPLGTRPTSGLVERLRREGPVLPTESEQHDFEWSINMASSIEEALGKVTTQASAHQNLVDAERRARSHALDHAHQLDVSRANRAKARGELMALKSKETPRFLFIGQKVQLAVLARGMKARELERHQDHVVALKKAVASLEEQTKGLAFAVQDSLAELTHRRGLLRDAVRRLHGHDPGMLQHLLGLLTGRQRVHLKDAMNDVAPKLATPVQVEGGTEEGGGGLRAKLSKPGLR